MNDDDRAAALSTYLRNALMQGWRLESSPDRFSAVLATGKPVNHVLHAILTLLTCFCWGAVWAFLGLTGGVKRCFVQVDPEGRITSSASTRAAQ